MWGVSYPGFAAAVALVGPHPALKAVSPQAAWIDYWMNDDLHRYGAMRIADYSTLDRERALALLFRQRSLNFEPGTRFLYSIGGYLLLAEIVARVSGRPFAEQVRRAIFDPLGMRRSYFRGGTRRRGAVAHGYARRGGELGPARRISRLRRRGRADDERIRPRPPRPRPALWSPRLDRRGPPHSPRARPARRRRARARGRRRPGPMRRGSTSAGATGTTGPRTTARKGRSAAPRRACSTSASPPRYCATAPTPPPRRLPARCSRQSRRRCRSALRQPSAHGRSPRRRSARTSSAATVPTSWARPMRSPNWKARFASAWRLTAARPRFRLAASSARSPPTRSATAG
ncbi:MAG: serine hydrolase [Sphingomonas sp.]